MDGQQFAVSQEQRGALPLLRVHGELDINTAPRLKEAIIAALSGEGSSLAIDLSGVGFLDSSGSQVLMSAKKRTAESGGELYIIGAPPQALRLFQLVGLQDILHVCDEVDLPEAEGALTSTARANQRKVASENRLLAALPEQEQERLLTELERVPLSIGQTIYEADQPVEYVYFVRVGVISLVSVMQDGTIIEVATVGNEGMIGLPVFLGAETSAIRAVVQIPGEALRMRATALRDEVQNRGALAALLQRYTQAVLIQMAQGAACNRVHAIVKRCARWLLMTHDRTGSDEFPLRPEFLSQMLGARRAHVSRAARALEQAGFVRYSRGTVTILDRAGLETAACECYSVIEREYDRLYP